MNALQPTVASCYLNGVFLCVSKLLNKSSWEPLIVITNLPREFQCLSMALSVGRKGIIEVWYAEFSDDRDQISLSIEEVTEKHLKLSCDMGFIIFSLNTERILISSEGSDKFIDSLVDKCNLSIEKDSSKENSPDPSTTKPEEELRNALIKFSDISKKMAAESFKR